MSKINKKRKGERNMNKKKKNRIFIAALILTALLLILFSGCEFFGGTSATDDGYNNSATGSGGGQNDNSDNNKTGNNETAAPTEAAIEIGYDAPRFSVELLNGENENLSDYRGKATLIYFWATWNEICVSQMPDIQKLSETYAGDLVVLAINCNDNRDAVDYFIRENGYTFKIGFDENWEIQDKYPSPTLSIPYAVIINPDGIIAGIFGEEENIYAVYEAHVKAALGR